MGSLSKTMKKYERRILLGLVILLLVSFTVVGAVQCGTQGGPAVDHGGSFQVTPAKRATVSSQEFFETWPRYDRFRGRLGSPSLAYLPYLQMERKQMLPGPAGIWAHLCETDAGKAVGYHCGDGYQKGAAVRSVVQMVTGGLAFNDASYEKFLREFYGGAARDFEKTVAEVVIKDQFLRPLIDTRRYGVGYEEAYEAWKKQQEYVDLEYVALRGRDFALRARQVETTRSRLDTLRDPLDRAVATAGSMYAISNKIDEWSQDHDGAPPAALEELGFPAERGLPQDGWMQDYRYVVDSGRATLTSAGPDGVFDTADDVTEALTRELRTRIALREVGLGLLEWRRQTEAWPEALAKLLEAPRDGARPPLFQVRQDGWDRDLVYRVGDEGAVELFSVGADGQPGTADDVSAAITEDVAVIEPGAPFAPFLDESLRDAWDRAFRIRMGLPARARWDVQSAGPDGAFDTEDDIRSGNEGDLLQFYERADIRSDFLVPAKRRFEAIYVHLPLLPDEVLRRLWAAYPDLHPDEGEAFDRWREYGPRPYYGAEDPADAEAGHGAELAGRIAPDATPFLVPDVAIFGDAPEDLVAADSPDREPYLEGGWRAILLREQFLENVMNHLLQKARESHTAWLAWERAKAAFEAGEGEDPGAEPEEITFQTLLGGELAPFLPAAGQPAWIGMVAPEAPLSREEWEAEENIGDIQLTVAGLSPLIEAGQYGAVPVILNGALTKAILRNLEYVSERQPELDEVRDEIFERYLEKRRVDLAGEALTRLKNQVGANAEADAWAKAVEEWQASLDSPALVEATGLFVGRQPPQTSSAPDDLSEEAKQRARRRDFVRQRGYEAVRSTADQGISEGARVGTVGRTVLRDESSDGTDGVFLVRVKERQFPPPEAFSPFAYAGQLMQRTLGNIGLRSRDPSAPRTGIIPVALYEYFGDIESIKRKFKLSTEVDLEERGR